MFELAMGLARLGTLVNFVSHTVIIGFSAGAAVLIASTQIKAFFGTAIPADASFVETLRQLGLQVTHINPYVTAVGIFTMLSAVVARKYVPMIPFMISATILGALFASALTLAVSIGRSLAIKSGQRIDSNQEFIGQGLSNIVGSFFSSYPSAGSFNRSGANYEAGAEMLAREARRRQKPGGGLYLHCVKDAVREFLGRGGYLKDIGKRNLFMPTDDVVAAIYPRLDTEICRSCSVRIIRACNVALPVGEVRKENAGGVAA